MLPCINKKLLGVDCLGCGLQRSLVLLLKGEFNAAFHMYPAVYPIIALVVFTGSGYFFDYKYDWQIKIGLILVTATTMIISYIIKMNFIFN